MSSNPKTPSEWKDKFASQRILDDLPGKSANRTRDDFFYIRDVCLDFEDLLENRVSSVVACADVLWTNRHQLSIPFRENGRYQIYARVIAATQPLEPNLEPATDDECVLVIYAYQLDQPVTVSGSVRSEKLELGGRNIGVRVILENGGFSTEYISNYGDLEGHPPYFRANLLAESRLCAALSWNEPLLAYPIAKHVVRATSNTTAMAELNGPALALLHRLARRIQAADTEYAPPLQLDVFLSTLKDTFATVKAFQEQYDRFVDKEQESEVRIQAGETMLDHASRAIQRQDDLGQEAESRYKQAVEIVRRCSAQFEADQVVLDAASDRFEAGIKKWVEKKKREAIIGIFTAVVGFALALGMIAFGDAAAVKAAPAQLEGAVQAAQAAEKVGETAVKAPTMGKLKDAAIMSAKLYGSMKETIVDIEQLKHSPDSMPTRDQNGDLNGTGDLDEIVSLAAWDVWQLQADQQLEQALKLEIDGASEYRLALRSHTINGKLFAQATAQAIEAGRNYAHAVLDGNLARKDVGAIRRVLADDKGERQYDEEMKSRFFIRLLLIRTIAMIHVEDTLLAFKDYTLSDGRVKLELMKPAEELYADLVTIEQDFRNALSSSSSDSSEGRWQILASEIDPEIVTSLKTSHSARFTLVPEAGFAGLFLHGNRWRVYGLDVLLKGVVPKPEALRGKKRMQVRIDITTSGIYGDIKDEKIFNFTMIPLHREHTYGINAQGKKKGKNDSKSTYKGDLHTNPTPFIQWTIRIANADQLNLEGLKDVKLTWKGARDLLPNDGDGGFWQIPSDSDEDDDDDDDDDNEDEAEGYEDVQLAS